MLLVISPQDKPKLTRCEYGVGGRKVSVSLEPKWVHWWPGCPAGGGKAPHWHSACFNTGLLELECAKGWPEIFSKCRLTQQAWVKPGVLNFWQAPADALRVLWTAWGARLHVKLGCELDCGTVIWRLKADRLKTGRRLWRLTWNWLPATWGWSLWGWDGRLSVLPSTGACTTVRSRCAGREVVAGLPGRIRLKGEVLFY